VLDRSVSRKRRPVDALFGDRTAVSYPNYIVEQPQPVTTVSPPPPEVWTTPDQDAVSIAEPVAAPTLPDAAPIAPVQKAVEPAAAYPSAPIAASPVASQQDRISQLYDQVRVQLSDSRAVAKECMELLLKARMAYTEGDNAEAEYYTELVDARLTESALSQQASHRPIVWVIGLWNLAMFLVAGVTLIGTYFLNHPLFGGAVGSEALVLIRTVAWGVIGAGLGAMTTLIWSVSHREYDPANDLGYFAKVLVGAELGIFLVVLQAIVVVGDLSIGIAQFLRIFAYFLSALVGFGQDAIVEFMREVSTRIREPEG
jgi:hypothetical protein